MMEQKMEFMAKAAADSYMLNLNEQDKNYLSANKEMYVKEYFKVFEIAMGELNKKNQTRFQEFGQESEPGKLFK